MSKLTIIVATLSLTIHPFVNAFGQVRPKRSRPQAATTRRLEPSTYVVLEINPPNIGVTPALIRTVRRRIESYGAKVYEIGRYGGAGSNSIYVQYTLTSNPERLKGLITSPGKLEIRPVIAPPFPANIPSFPTRQEAEQALPDGEAILVSEDGKVEPHFVVLEKRPLITNSDVVRAEVVYFGERSDSFNSYAAKVFFTSAANQRLKEWASKDPRKWVAFVWNGEVFNWGYYDTKMWSPLHLFSPHRATQKDEAEDISILLNAGPLPARLVFIKEDTVDARKIVSSRDEWPPHSMRGLSFTKQAEMYVRKWWDEHFTPCQGGYVIQDIRILHLRNITFRASPRRLTEVDRLNGIEWSGTVSASAALVRQSPGTGQWRDWVRGGSGFGGSYAFSAERRNGRWKFEYLNYAGEPIKIMCPAW